MLAGLPHRLLRLIWCAWPRQVRKRALPHLIAGVSPLDRHHLGLPDVEGLLRQVAANGFVPSAIIDVGANVGAWATTVTAVFPQAPILLIDGNPECRSTLEAIATASPPPSEAVSAALGPDPRESVSFYQAGHGSGLLRELTVNRWGTIEVPMTTLDRVACRMGDPAARTLLLKLDVQGYELEVLKGGAATLARTEVAILEVATIPYNEGAPLLHEVVAFMATHGFVVFDFCGQFRRETDHALFQTDVVFVHQNSGLRAPKPFWASEVST